LASDPRIEWNASFLVIFFGSVGVLGFGFLDDRVSIAWPWHLIFQCSLATLVFAAGMRIDLEAYLGPGFSLGGGWATGLAFVAVSVWVLSVMNALNWADGQDGLLPGIALISFLTLFALSLRPEVNQPTVGILALALAALALALLVFNWHPARILAGTGGAYFFGFTLAVLAIYAGTKVATAILVLTIPLFDAGYVILRRIFQRRSPFQPDTEHLHHQLAAFGWSPPRVAVTYLLVTGGMAVLALSFRDAGKLVSFLGAGAVLGMLTFGLSLWLHLKRHTL
jgi:UDP-GlcNAc:undecaprenyl-phosphate/decaprenyl-phosphate GlcNAc-1-phosphate transferase